ncbi:MAG: riboflavin kinase [Candidatus Binatia bacterium]
MIVVRHLSDVRADQASCALAVGRFDGLHAGHRALITRLCARARAVGGEAVVALDCTTATAPALTSLRQRLLLLGHLGLDRTVLLRAGDPLDAAVVAARLGAAVLVTGRAVHAHPPCTADAIDPVLVDGARVSASALRSALATGDLTMVQRGLGRPHAVEGRIVHGFHRGATIGVPTANIRVRDVALPPDGVYAVRARLGDRELGGVANIGFNPTFGNRVRSVETHLFDFNGDVYGQRLAIALLARLRGEQKFSGVEALVAQIRTDIAAARDLLGRMSHGD